MARNESNRERSERSRGDAPRTDPDGQGFRGYGGTESNDDAGRDPNDRTANRSANRGRSEIDQGAYDDGGYDGRTYGQGVYDDRPGQSGQQSFGREPGRGQRGGAARANQYGSNGGDQYGGGGPNGGADTEQQRFGGYGGTNSTGFNSASDDGRQRTTSGPSHAGRGPKGWKRSDERLRDDVSDQLERSHDVDASDIEVRVENGEVTLTGTVDARQTKRMAEDIVHAVAGVTDVQNQLRVQSR